MARGAEVRLAGSDDVDALAALHLATVSFAYRDWFPPHASAPELDALRGVWQHDLAAAHAVFVAEDAGALVGSAVARTNGDLARLHVHPDRWGAGIGQRLHDAAVDALRRQRHPRAGLWVIEQNGRARSLYERNGWVLDPTQVLRELDVTEVRYALDLRQDGASPP